MLYSQPFAIPALVLFIVAIPLVLGIVPRNRIYGVRTPKARSDDSIWYRVNRFGGLMVMLACIGYAVIAMLWPYRRMAGNNLQLFLIHLAGFVLPLFLALILTRFYTRRL